MDTRTISLCITTFERVGMTLDSFKPVLEDPRISEIVIIDDASQISVFNELMASIKHPKVTLVRNNKNKNCYLNKQEALKKATSDYAIIFDSDNVIYPEYLDKIFAEQWEPTMILAPAFAEPNFNYTAFNDVVVDKTNVAEYMHKPMFSTALNTSNYFIHRETFLSTLDNSIDPNTYEALWTNYNWLKAGHKIKIVKDLSYYHAVHGGSHYQQNCHRSGDLLNEIENKLKQLR